MPRALVLGGGIAGLASAIALGRAGWTVSVHERAKSIEPLGAALSLWPNAISALDRLGVLASVDACGAPLRSMLLADWRGKPIIGPFRVHSHAIMVTRAALQGRLADALGSIPLHLGDMAEAVDQDEYGATVRFADGRTMAADIVIDAGGIWSTFADAPGRARPQFSGYGGVVALSGPVGGAGLDGVAAEYWGNNERFGIFELPQHERYWFYMQDQRVGQAAPDHDWITRRAMGWPKSVGEAVSATAPDRLTPFAISATSAPKSLGRGRIISVGDAAHAMEPNLGQGACQALEDAVVLGMIATSRAPEQMLPAFERLRLDRIRGIVRRSSEGRLGAHGPRAIQAITRIILRAMPAGVNERIIRSAQTMPVIGAGLRRR